MTQRNIEHSVLDDTTITADKPARAPSAKLSEVVKVTANFQKKSSVFGYVLFGMMFLGLLLGSPILVCLSFMTLLTYGGALGVVRRLQDVRWLSRWRLVRFSRGIRKSFVASPVSLALYAICFFLAALTGSTLVLTQSPLVITLYGVSIGIVLSAATFLDWYARLKYVLSISIAKQVVKWIVAFLATITVFLSTVIAKQLTHSIAQADPASMPEFVRLVSAFVFPFALSAVISASLTALMVAQYLVLFVGLSLAMPLKVAVSSFSPSIRKHWGEIGYRVLNGKRPLNSRPRWGQLINGVQHFFRPVGTGAIAALVSLLGIYSVNLAGHIPKKYMQALLVMTEYRAPHLCENVLDSKYVAYLQDGYVSVATPLAEGYKFSVEKCHK